MGNMKNWSMADLKSAYDLSLIFDSSIDTIMKDYRNCIEMEFRKRTEDCLKYSRSSKSVKINKNPDISNIVMEYFNYIRSMYIRPKPIRSVNTTSARIKAIQNRVNDGYDFDCFKDVILSRFMLWSDDDIMKPNLTPETLFRASNFPKYYEASDEILKKSINWTSPNGDQVPNGSILDW